MGSGILRAVDSSALTRTGMVMRWAGFVRRNEPGVVTSGPPSDVFSLGAVLAFAATGREPFGSGSGEVLLDRVVSGEPDLSDLPRRIRPLVERCMISDQRQQPTTGSAPGRTDYRRVGHSAGSGLWRRAEEQAGTRPCSRNLTTVTAPRRRASGDAGGLLHTDQGTTRVPFPPARPEPRRVAIPEQSPVPRRARGERGAPCHPAPAAIYPRAGAEPPHRAAAATFPRTAARSPHQQAASLTRAGRIAVAVAAVLVAEPSPAGAFVAWPARYWAAPGWPPRPAPRRVGPHRPSRLPPS